MTSVKLLVPRVVPDPPAIARDCTPVTAKTEKSAAERTASEEKALAYLKAHSPVHTPGPHGPAATIAKLQGQLDATNQQITALKTKIAGEDPKSPETRKDKRELAHLKQRAKNLQLEIYQILYPPKPKPVVFPGSPMHPGTGNGSMNGTPGLPGKNPVGSTGLAPIGNPTMPTMPGSGNRPAQLGPDPGAGLPDPYPFQPPWLVVPGTTPDDFPGWQMGDPWQVPPGLNNPGGIGAPPINAAPLGPTSPTDPLDPGANNGDAGDIGGDGGDF